MENDPTQLVLFAALAAGAFAVINGLVKLANLAVKAAIKKRNSNSATNPSTNSSRFSSADRLLLEQTHQGVQESMNQHRLVSDVIKDGFHEMSSTLAESLNEDKKQTETLEKLVRALEDSARR